MSQNRVPPENQDANAEGSAAKEGDSPMDRFRTLARDLLKVSREQLDEEHRRYEKHKLTAKKNDHLPT